MHADCSGATGVVAPPPPPEATTATTSVEVYSTDGIDGQTTQRLIFTLPPTAVNVYAMAGDDKHPVRPRTTRTYRSRQQNALVVSADRFVLRSACR